MNKNLEKYLVETGGYIGVVPLGKNELVVLRDANIKFTDIEIGQALRIDHECGDSYVMRLAEKLWTEFGTDSDGTYCYLLYMHENVENWEQFHNMIGGKTHE